MLKLIGDGISTINARTVDFIDAAILDVSGLTISPGTYKVIDATSFIETNLTFAEGTDTNDWSFEFDIVRGDLLLSYGSELLGDMDGSGKVDRDDINPFVLALIDPNAYIATYGMDPNVVGDCDSSGRTDTDDINPFVALLTGGQTVPEPATLSLLSIGTLALIGRRGKNYDDLDSGID